MKNRTKFIFALSVIMLLFLASCGKIKALEEENEQLKSRLSASDSNSEILANNLEEVNTLLDSIDIAQETINLDLEKGVAYPTYVTKIQSINKYIHDTEDRLNQIEGQLAKSNNQNKVYFGIIKSLKGDLAEKQELILSLTEQVENFKTENQELIKTVDLQNKELDEQNRQILENADKIAQQRQELVETNQKGVEDKAGYLYDQGIAAEKLAAKTRLAGRKKKALYQEAYNYYKKALDLGKTEAQAKMDALEEKIK